jgi:hypothetical protein
MPAMVSPGHAATHGDCAQVTPTSYRGLLPCPCLSQAGQGLPLSCTPAFFLGFKEYFIYLFMYLSLAWNSQLSCWLKDTSDLAAGWGAEGSDANSSALQPGAWRDGWVMLDAPGAGLQRTLLRLLAVSLSLCLLRACHPSRGRHVASGAYSPASVSEKPFGLLLALSLDQRPHSPEDRGT